MLKISLALQPILVYSWCKFGAYSGVFREFGKADAFCSKLFFEKDLSEWAVQDSNL